MKGDWVELLLKGFNSLDMSVNEDIIKNETKAQFKSRIKKQLEKHMLAEMKHKQEEHSYFVTFVTKTSKSKNI